MTHQQTAQAYVDLFTECTTLLEQLRSQTQQHEQAGRMTLFTHYQRITGNIERLLAGHTLTFARIINRCEVEVQPDFITIIKLKEDTQHG